MTTTKPEVAVAGRAWTIDPAHTQVEFGVRHMMLSTVKGHFPAVEGTIRFDEDDVAESTVEVEIDAASIDTRNEDRDAHLRSEDFLDVEHHKTIRFASRAVEADGDGLKVRGDLTIRGTTRPVELQVDRLGEGVDPWGNDRIGFRAETRIRRKDFGLTWNQALEAGGVLVGDEVRITLDVQAVAADSPEG